MTQTTNHLATYRSFSAYIRSLPVRDADKALTQAIMADKWGNPGRDETRYIATLEDRSVIEWDASYPDGNDLVIWKFQDGTTKILDIIFVECHAS